MSYETEFPSFPKLSSEALAAIEQAGFSDASWHNDTCPSFSNIDRNMILFADHAVKSEREFDAPRFTLHKDDGGIAEGPAVFSVETEAELIAELSKLGGNHA